ncbi:flagellar motor stator protein MotA [Luteimonas sp. SJ-92]|uniref:Flagellar motor stator protein MotA n=1 Tax=Luteimonas salinisoli TaxID=2752307 RepID=A0A853J8V3_9GAMM|nr:flagellar motor stator protein MotA [Luteimonas salinisoli]NZA25626.1 flagellar motor stator protein MotA [Luteimonas salinisoli]
MLVIVGFVVVIVSVVGGYVLSHGQLLALWQPFELLIIGGAALGAFVAGNPMKVVKGAARGIPGLLKGPRYSRDDYLEILSMVYDVLQKIRREGFIGIESDIEQPGSSALFARYPQLAADHHLMEFVTDCLRLMVGGGLAPHELEQLLEVELETHHAEAAEPAHAVQTLADSLPGFGIVAAVLGIVITMSMLGGETSAIGAHVAAALVGTFLGILLGYGFVGPLASALAHRAHEEGKAFEIIKMALVCNLRGYAPQVAIEFARKLLFSDVRPSFTDLDGRLRARKA